MQDENAIEAQHSPRVFKAASLAKNKSETAAEGMPPQKTLKTSHVPSVQPLEATPLNPITNLPRAHSRTHPPPGTGKGKHAQEKKPHAKSHITVGSDKFRFSIQTRLDFETTSKRAPQSSSPEHDAPSEQDLETLRSLEKGLEELKQTVEELQHHVEQETAKVHHARQTFRKEEDKLMEKIQDAQKAQQESEDQIADQISEIKRHEQLVDDLSLQIENKSIDIFAWEREVEDFEERTNQELMKNELGELVEEVQMLKEMIDQGMIHFEQELENIDNFAQVKTDPIAVEALRREANERDIYIQDLECELDVAGADLEAVLGISIEGEFMALRSRYNLTPGNELDKEVAKCQARLTGKFNRQLAALKAEHALKTDLITMKTMSHNDRLAKLKRNIENANETIARSDQDFKQVEQERLRVQSRTEAVAREIEGLRLRLRVGC